LMRIPTLSGVLLALFAAVNVHAAIGPVTTMPNALPDSFVIARVGSRPISVYAFRDGYFSSDGMSRPAQDSLGRVSFLQDLINKEILGQTALKTGYKFSFQDRADLRDFSSQTLSNMLFMRTVRDSSGIGEDSLRHVYAFYGREVKLRILYFKDRE